MLNNRRRFLQTASIGAVSACSLYTNAEPLYPSRPITLVVPFTPGGSVDIAGRLIADKLTQSLRQSLVVDNRGGAGGAIGSTFVARAHPDGYTLIVTSQSTHVVNPAVNSRLPYDAVKDFAPVTLIGRVANVLQINADLPIKTFDDLVKYARANPQKLNYASAGNGTVSHLSMELLKTQAGIPMAHIPYRGAGVALTDLLSGQVQLAWSNLSSNFASIKNGKLRALAVASPERIPQLPDVPTFGELKLPDLNLTSWNGIAAPAGTPAPIIQRIYFEMRKIIENPSAAKIWEEKGMIIPEDVSPEDYRREIIKRIEFYRHVAKTHNIEVA